MRVKIHALEKVTRENNSILTGKLQELSNIQTKTEEFKGEQTITLKNYRGTVQDFQTTNLNLYNHFTKTIAQRQVYPKLCKN